MSGIDLILSDRRGIYIPRDFAEFDFTNWSGIEDEDIEILKAGPEESDWYWETWDQVLATALYTEPQGKNTWHLHQDGDLFMVCEALMTDEEYYNFYGEHRLDLDADSRFETDNWYDTSMEIA